MIMQWLSWLNCGIFALALLLSLTGGIFWLKQSRKIISEDPVLKESGLPKNSFELPNQVYLKIGEPLLSLHQAPPVMQLPDLRQQLIYYGRNGRPDALSENGLLHFSFNGTKAMASTRARERLYLIFDRKQPVASYIFSPNNEPSSLWIEAAPLDREAQVNVIMENDKGERILQPESCANFRLPEKEFSRYSGTQWELGSFRVDGTLLARQRARWYGIDRFLEHHGGEESGKCVGKHRIDFGENETLYSVFVNVEDCLIWDQNQWKSISPGRESLNHPLLTIKKIEDKLMTCELWDIEGKGKVLLNLLKSMEPSPVQNIKELQQAFKFVGARTKTQCVFEINEERVTLRPSDWLLLTPKGWKKLETEEEIDDYVQRKLIGTLLVFDKLAREGERQIMKGTLYTPSRNESQLVELPLITERLKASMTHETSKEEEEVGSP